jgi:hypothetical protein
MYHKRGLWAIKAKNGGVFPKHAPKVKDAAPAEKPPKFYPADDVKKPLPNRRKPKPTKLRSLPLAILLSLWIHLLNFKLFYQSILWFCFALFSSLCIMWFWVMCFLLTVILK